MPKSYTLKLAVNMSLFNIENKLYILLPDSRITDDHTIYGRIWKGAGGGGVTANDCDNKGS